MRRRIIINILLFLVLSINIVFAYDDSKTHPEITKISVENSTLDYYLKKNLNFTNGLNTFLQSDGRKFVLDWLMDGSFVEDDLDICRASNHFHDPLKTWSTAGMNDSPFLANLVCYFWIPYYSDVTWATGFTEPPSTPIPYNPGSEKSPNIWANARTLYYNALTATTQTTSENNFAEMFKALGQVLHLLQDMSVPAHVRNDSQSHFIYSGIIDVDGKVLKNPTKWVNNPFEHYIKANSQLVNIEPEKWLKPTFTNPRLMDFWDTNQYNGENPSKSTTLGLAEITNANYFSDNTIYNNNPSPEHFYWHPFISYSNYSICEHNEMGTNIPRKYICRNDSSNPFNAISLLNEEASITNDNISTLELVLDNNVHDSYARELLPLAIGYSSQLLQYFFRGQLEVKCLPVIEENKISYVKLTIKNVTLGEAMTNGKLMLTGKYTDSNNKEIIFGAKYGASDHAVIASLEYKQSSEELRFFFPSGTQIPVDKWASIKLTLTYQGKLGNEEGAVIGKVFNPGKLKFNEEWNNGLTGNYNWYHLNDNYTDPNCANVTGQNTTIQSGTLLVKDNAATIGSYSLSCGTHLNKSLIYSGTDSRFPIPITKNTSLQFNIPQWTTNAPNPEWNIYDNWQVMELWLQDNQYTYVFMLSLDDQFYYVSDPHVYYFTFDPGYTTVDSFQNMFQLYGITMPDNLKLMQIDFYQRARSSTTLAGQQQMIVDFVRVIEHEDTELAQTP